MIDQIGMGFVRVDHVGWRVRIDTYFDCTRFDITTDGGNKWTTTHFWEGTPSAGAIVRAGYAIFAQHPGSRIVEFEEVNGTWIPRIEEEED